MKKEILDKCPEYLKNFLFYMETILNRSPKTVDAYYVDLKLYLTFLYCKNKGILPFLFLTAKSKLFTLYSYHSIFDFL
jgi:hypothetical protein